MSGDKIASLELVPVVSIAQGLGGQREGLLPRQQLREMRLEDKKVIYENASNKLKVKSYFALGYS